MYQNSDANLAPSQCTLSSTDEAARERDALRLDRHKERARERNLARAGGGDKRAKQAAARERDISEQIALGLPARASGSGETQFDQRLFNQSRGMDSGFNDDEAYNVYDKPWGQGGSVAAGVYRPGKNVEKEVYGDDLDTLMKTNRYVCPHIQLWLRSPLLLYNQPALIDFAGPGNLQIFC